MCGKLAARYAQGNVWTYNESPPSRNDVRLVASPSGAQSCPGSPCSLLLCFGSETGAGLAPQRICKKQVHAVLAQFGAKSVCVP